MSHQSLSIAAASLPPARGMTAVRYVLAFSLIVFHCCILSGHALIWPVDGNIVVKSFFVISGFFVLQSLLRSDSLKSYALRRFHRTYPLYLAVVVGSTLLCSLFSSLSLTDYFTNVQTFRYLLFNALFLNFLEPSLPGVFTHNVLTTVNGSLWFMKVVVLFYALLPLVVWFMLRLGKVLVLVILFILSVCYIEVCSFMYERTGHALYDFLLRQLPAQMPYFLAGMSALLFFNRFRRHILWWWVASAILVVLMLTVPCRVVFYFEPLVYTVVIFTLGYFVRPLRPFHRVPDITYGLYLIHFPVIQMLLQRLPTLPLWLLFLMVVAVTMTCAAIMRAFIK